MRSHSPAPAGAVIGVAGGNRGRVSTFDIWRAVRILTNSRKQSGNSWNSSSPGAEAAVIIFLSPFSCLPRSTRLLPDTDKNMGTKRFGERKWNKWNGAEL